MKRWLPMADSGCNRLAVSMVVHRWCEQDIYPALETLGRSLQLAQAQGLVDDVALYVLYNGELELDSVAHSQKLSGVFPFRLEVLPVLINGGYGKANNLLLETLSEQQFDAVLVMNPDVVIDDQALSKMLWRLSGDPSCGLVVPRLLDPESNRDVYGCKRYPSLAVLATRQFRVLQRFSVLLRLNARYEYRDQQPNGEHRGVELCSGCFMLARMRFWKEMDGFDSRYFMYFEDFDLSLRGAAQGWAHVYEPGAIVHHSGGGAARKPLRHRWWFVRSAFRFFMSHGWRIWRVGKVSDR